MKKIESPPKRNMELSGAIYASCKTMQKFANHIGMERGKLSLIVNRIHFPSPTDQTKIIDGLINIGLVSHKLVNEIRFTPGPQEK